MPQGPGGYSESKLTTKALLATILKAQAEIHFSAKRVASQDMLRRDVMIVTRQTHCRNLQRLVARVTGVLLYVRSRSAPAHGGTPTTQSLR